MERLRQAFTENRVLLDLDAHSMGDVMQAAVDQLVQLRLVAEADAERVLAGLREREEKVSTAIGHAVAVPHVYLEVVPEPVVLFVRLSHGVNLGAPDGIPTRFVFFLLGPPAAASEHLDTLASIARLAADDEFRYDAGRADTTSELLTALDRFSARREPVEQPQPSSGIPVGLRRTGKLLGGIREDLTRWLPRFASDFRDGLHPKCVASTLFLFFACASPAVIFGGLMAGETQGAIGPMEMMVATAICGVTYALLAGQPLIILGGTGPLLVITAILYQLCAANSIEFLPAYAWVGLWSALFTVLLAVTDASWLIRYFTRFTDETFSALISLIFIFKAVENMIHVFSGVEEGGSYEGALFSLLLAMGTFYIAMSLSQFRRSSFLLPWMREFFADFGPTIAMVSMAGVAIFMSQIPIATLPVPDGFATTSGRDWWIDLGAAPLWVKLGAAGPALLVAVLIYLDQNITARLVNSPDHKLQKGPGYHLDLLVVGGLVAVCSLFGLPWLVAATVRSLNHVRSLASVDEVVTRGGETREQIVHVRENRVTGLAIHLLIAASLFLLPYLAMLPKAVLYGLFLYMGVASIAGNQFFERLGLWLKAPDLYPRTHYIRRAPIRVIHTFTGIQLACLGLLWMVKEHHNPWIKLLFPLFIALLAPVRWLMSKWFQQEHLDALDAEEEPEDEETHWSG